MTNFNQLSSQIFSGYRDLMIISFCIPLVGFLLYFVNRTNESHKAKVLAYMSLLGYIVRFIVNYLYLLSFPAI